MITAAGPSHVPQPWIETPLIESAQLSKLAGVRVLLKLELLQPSGSFKSRGIGNLIRQAVISHPTSTPLHFYSSSGGNAGIAAVTASKTLGYPCTVVVPLSTKPMMIDKIKLAGAAEVIQEGETWHHADRHLRDVVIPRAEAKGEVGVYVPPFDHQDIWDGAETMVDEIEVQMGQLQTKGLVTDSGEHQPERARVRVLPDAIICSVGGGGLLAGISQGLAKRQEGSSASNTNTTHIIAVETEGAESLHKSIVAKELVTLPAITSLATTLGAIQVARRAFEAGMKQNCSSVVVSDKQAVDALLRLADDERLLVEPSCGAALAVIYSGLLQASVKEKGVTLRPESTVVVVVCGGVGVDRKSLQEWTAHYKL